MKKFWILLILPFIIGAAPSKAFNFVTQTTIRASEVNTNYNDLYDYLAIGVDTIRADGLDAITEIKSTLRSGSDQTLITGTKGSTTEMCIWNGDGDAIGLSQITGTTTGMGTNALRITGAGYTSCTNLGTDANGRIICN